MENKEKTLNANIRAFLLNNIVTIIFLAIVVFGIVVSDDHTASSLVNDITTRFFRNGLLVLSLIIPVIAGLGLNFGIVVGAFAGMLSIIFVRYHMVPGIGGLLLCFLIATPIAILFGFLTGKLYNKTRGQEMIASLIVGYFAEMLYLIFVLIIIGGVIPVKADHFMVIPANGIGIRSAFDMGRPIEELDSAVGLSAREASGMARSLDRIWRMDFMVAIALLMGALLVFFLIRRYLANKNPAAAKDSKMAFFLKIGFCGAALLFAVYCIIWPNSEVSKLQQIPVATGLVIIAIALFTAYFTKTKLGQDCRSVGQNQHIANAAGINVDKTRIIATIISTVLAAWGMIVYLQSMGTVQTYTAQRQIGLFSVAALLIGGASVTKASIKNVVLGLVIFHSMFIVSNSIGRFISSDEGVGEFMRSTLVYAVIGISLGLHVWKTLKASRDKQKLDPKEVAMLNAASDKLAAE